MRHEKFFLFFIFFVVSFLFFSNVSAITNENDVNFNWMSSLVYDDKPSLFYSDSTLFHTNYNNTDYYEHVLPVIGVNHTNFDYKQDINYFDDIHTTIVNYNEFFYGFEFYVINGINVYDNNYTYVNNIDDISNSMFDVIVKATTDDNYFYILAYLYSDEIYKIFRYDFDFNFVNVILEIEQVVDNYTVYDVVYYNQSFYFSCWTYPDGDAIILRYDMDGNLIDDFDISSDIDLGLCIAYYQGYFYIYDLDNRNIHVYDTQFNFISEFDKNFNMNVELYIYSDLVYYINGDDYHCHVLNLSFEQQSYYDITKYYDLFDSIDNIKFNYTQINNPIGHYDASYSFLDDTDGTNPKNFICKESGGTIDVISEYQQHKKVVRLCDTGATQLSLEKSFDGNAFGIIEYYWLIDNSDKPVVCSFAEVDNFDGIVILMYSGYFHVYDGDLINTTIEIFSDNWYHMKIEFNCSDDSYDLYINQQYIDNYNFGDDIDNVQYCAFSEFFETGYCFYIDAIGFDWFTNYTVGQNLEYCIENNGFYNEFTFLNENYDEIISIECKNGSYFINSVDIEFNVFFNQSNYIYDTHIVVIDINQLNENGTICFYNESNFLLHNELFNTSYSGNVKYVKYIQYYQNSNHFISINDIYIISNNTMIVGNNGYLSYYLENIGVLSLIGNAFNITGYGLYRIYVSNDTYGSEFAIIYQLTNWIELRNREFYLDLSYFEYLIQNPYLIFETINGLYLIDNLKIFNNLGLIILYDDRDFVYYGDFSCLNVDNDSLFYVSNEKLYYQVNFNDTDLEYIKLIFEINPIINLNYQLLYTTFLNDSNVNIVAQMKLKNNDGSYTIMDFMYGYDSNIEILSQSKSTVQIEFYISDNDLFSNNKTVFGYIKGFTFNYNEQITISIFIERFLIMLIPIIIILTLSFTISYVFRDKNSKDMLNKQLFFPIFIIASFIVFIMGFFDSWILFILIVAVIAYVINKKDDDKNAI